MSKRDTGFHRLDADYTQGRGREMATADRQGRMDMARGRHKVSLRRDDPHPPE